MTTKAEMETEIQKLRNVGSQMSNACFNLSQSDNLHPADKKSLAELVRAWDSVRRSSR